MKKEGHPAYQDILFVDTATGTKFVCGSTLQPKATETYEGKEYPVYYASVSSASHPFFTGSQPLSLLCLISNVSVQELLTGPEIELGSKTSAVNFTERLCCQVY